MFIRARGLVALTVSLASLVLLVGASSAQAAGPESSARVINGTKVTDASFAANWNFLISLQQSELTTELNLLEYDDTKKPRPVADLTRHICGGSLIAPRLVLTAAHCVVESGSLLGFEQGAITLPGSFSIVYGSKRLNEKKSTKDRRVEVQEVFIHPDYVSSRARHDVAVLRLAKPVTGVTPARIATNADRVMWGDGSGLEAGANIVGWGLTSKKKGRITQPGNAIEAPLPIVSDRTCGDSEKVGALPSLPFEPQWVVCIGKPDSNKSLTKNTGVSACFGDSGGPLTVRDAGGAPVIVGVASYVDSRINFGLCEGYSFYSRVASDAEWIQSIAGSTGGPAGLEAPAPRVVSTRLSSVRIALDAPTTGPAPARYEVHGNTLGPLLGLFFFRANPREHALDHNARLLGSRAAAASLNARVKRLADESGPEEDRFERRFGELLRALLAKQPFPLAYTSGSTVTVPGLVPSSRKNAVDYRFYVRSVAADGSPSSIRSMKVRMPVDAVPPTRPGKPRPAQRLDGLKDWWIQWDRSRDNDSVGYYVLQYRMVGAKKWKTRTASFWAGTYLERPKLGRPYQLRVYAVDMAGNKSRMSRQTIQAPLKCKKRCKPKGDEGLSFGITF